MQTAPQRFAENETADTVTIASPLESFTGRIEPSKPSLLYRGGLACLTLAMVLLPAIYAGLVLLAAYGVLWHLQHNLWIMEGRGGGVGKLIGYLGPAVIGGTLVVFMVKPFFAKSPKKQPPVSLDPAQEPLLFAFIQKICSLVGAPMPSRVDVDCQVNASASFRRGLLSKDLVLTIGLPLASGLDMRQFAGVLAHEFGHFAQGAGMRLTYIVRSVNHWFARVVYERDDWDLSLERAAKGTDLRIAIVLHAARGCIWLTRRILWGLMHAGHALSCFMLRQMEYDADSYEAKVSGSDVFEPTSVALQRLNVGLQMTLEDVRQSWTSKRLPENVPMLVQHRTSRISGEIIDQLNKSLSGQKTGIFDTHPCDADRARAVIALKQPGVFRLTQPATQLFSNFNETSKRVTEALYKNDVELEFSQENLISSEQALQETDANAQAEEAIRHLYGKVNITIFPLVTTDQVPPSADLHTTLTNWKQACSDWKETRIAAEAFSEVYTRSQGEQVKFQAVHHLLAAHFKLEPKPFGLPEHATSMAEQDAFAGQRLSEIKTKLAETSPEMEQFTQAVRCRVTSALQFLQADETSVTNKEELAAEVQLLLPITAAVAGTIPALQEMAPSMQGYTMLLQNRGSHARVEQVDAEIDRIAGNFRLALGRVEEILAGHAYPFSHAKGQLSLREFAKSDESSDNDWIQMFHETNSHLDKLFTLHFRLVGRLAAIALLVEKHMQNTESRTTAS